jgi:hypothetical protein
MRGCSCCQRKDKVQLEENDPAGRVLLLMVALEGCPVRANFPRNETLDSLSTLRKYSTSCHELSPTAGRGQWVMAVCDLTSDGRLSTYEESVLKLSKFSFLGKCSRREKPLKLLLPTKLARLGHFPPASQVGALLARCFLLYLFSVFT